MTHPEEYPDFFVEHSPFGYTMDDSKSDLESNIEVIEESELIACTE